MKPAIVTASAVFIFMSVNALGSKVTLFNDKSAADAAGCTVPIVYTFDTPGGGGWGSAIMLHPKDHPWIWTRLIDKPQSFVGPSTSHVIGYTNATLHNGTVNGVDAYGFVKNDITYCFVTYQVYQGEDDPSKLIPQDCPTGPQCVCAIVSSKDPPLIAGRNYRTTCPIKIRSWRF